MFSSTQHIVSSSIKNEIELHPAWLGQVSGLKAEKILRNRKQPFLYVLRTGEFDSECETDYYVTFINFDLTIKHQPFVISTTPEGWYYENGHGGGPYTDHTSIEHVLHLIMHCQKEECVPLINFQK